MDGVTERRQMAAKPYRTPADHVAHPETADENALYRQKPHFRLPSAEGTFAFGRHHPDRSAEREQSVEPGENQSNTTTSDPETGDDR